MKKTRLKWATASIALVLLTPLLGTVGMVRRMGLHNRTAAEAQGSEDVSPLLPNYPPGSRASPTARSLQEVLAHPDFVPSHHHPLLGRQAPDFELADQQGRTWKLRQLLGDGPAVLVFYHGSCPLCARQLLESDADTPLFRALGARVVSISSDVPQLTRRRFEQSGPFGFLMLSDPGDKVARAYQVFRRMQDGRMVGRPLHGTFVINRDGMVSWVNMGDAPFRRDRALFCQLAKIEHRFVPLSRGASP